jgi:hypothetical protein
VTLEQLAYLAEIIGVVLMVVSLTYLAQQFRQNTEMARVAAAEQGVQRDFDIVSLLLENKELTEVWVKGESDFESLDAALQNFPAFSRMNCSTSRSSSSCPGRLLIFSRPIHSSTRNIMSLTGAL